MAFLLFKNEVADIPAWESVSAAAATYHVGDALYFADGKAAKATGTNAPTHICMMEKKVETAGDPLYVMRIYDPMIFQTVLGVASPSIEIGAKYTIHTDGASITATETSGVAEVVGFDGTALGDTVYVRF